MFSIRAAQSSDAPELLAMTQSFAKEAHLDCTATLDGLTAGLFGPIPHAHALIAQADPQPSGKSGGAKKPAAIGAGFALWNYNYDILAGAAGIYLSDLYLAPEWRGLGIALAFFRALAQRAVAEDCGQLCWSPLVRAAPGFNLYQSLGDIPITAWTSRRLAGAELIAFAN